MQRFVVRLLALPLLAGLAAPAAAEELPPELADLSLEQLSDVVVTSVTRQEEKLSGAAASIFIISNADIRRSGAQTLPEALRLAPNLNVARVDASGYAISARGYNSTFANKLLVMIDGRSIYTPLFSGVFWDAQDVMLEDVDRIEVISGPGATIWGANAVNGVINVITRKASETQGGLLAGVAGNDQNAGALRYGGALGDGHYRVYGKYGQHDPSEDGYGAPSQSSWHRSQAGFRADWQRPDGAVTLSSDAYQGLVNKLIEGAVRISGVNLLGRVTRDFGNYGSVRVQAILDHTERAQPNAYDDMVHTVDLELQHSLRLGERHQLVWGGGYRYSRDRVVNRGSAAFLPEHINLHWSNLFLQDEISLLPSLKLTAGVKTEHNRYTGGETLPSLRLAWNRDGGGLLWGSLTRSVRAPARIDHDWYAPARPVIIAGKPVYFLAGGEDMKSELAKVAEIGYRAQPLPGLSYSATLYFSDFDRLRTIEQQRTGGALIQNMAQGRSNGVELWAQWQPAPAWRLDAGLVAQRVETTLLPGSRDTSRTRGLYTDDPANHWLLRVSHDWSERSSWDLHLRHTSSLPDPALPAYTELDLQWRYKLSPTLDLSLQGQNLLHRDHAEFGVDTGRNVMTRSLLLRLSQRF
jgi:iron complex outermembrane receptor protein